MPEPQYKVTSLGDEPVMVPESRVTAFCIRRCWGGHTAAQTWEAMKMLNKIRQGDTYKTRSGLTIEADNGTD